MDVVVVPIGGGGLIAGVATAVKGVRPSTRVIGVEPEGSNAMHLALEAGEPVRLDPVSVADGLNAPFAGTNTLAIVRELVDEVVLVSEEELAGALRFLYGRAKLACEPAGAAATAALLAGKVPHEQDESSSRSSRAATWPRDGRCYPGRAMKADIHPDYVLATSRAPAGTRSRRGPRSPSSTSRSAPTATRSTRASRSCSTPAVASSASSAGSSEPAAPAAAASLTSMSAPIGGQAVLEGVMMRGPSNWAFAVRKPDGEIAQVRRQINSVMARHRLFRLPVIRGVIALGESLAIGFRALAISANYAAQEGADDEEVSTELSRGA